MEDIGVGVNVAEGIVGVEIIGVRLGAIVIVKVGTLVGVFSACCVGRVPHEASNTMRITEDTIAIRFDVFIHESISASKHCDN